MSYFIRHAEIQDLQSIQTLYNHEVINGMATWNDEAKDLTHFNSWFQQLQQNQFPLFVIEHEKDHTVIGFADYSTFRAITGFKHTVEHSIFIAPQYAGLGLGTMLLKYLIIHAKNQGIHIMVAAIDHENIGSICLHKKFGFKQTGYMPEVGQKFGKWRDLVLMQLHLSECSQDEMDNSNF